MGHPAGLCRKWHQAAALLTWTDPYLLVGTQLEYPHAWAGLCPCQADMYTCHLADSSITIHLEDISNPPAFTTSAKCLSRRARLLRPASRPQWLIGRVWVVVVI